MAEDLFVDVRYQGLELGSRLRMEQFVQESAYLHHPTPMPVGSALVVAADDGLEIPVKVSRISEQVAGAEKPPGMFVTPQEPSPEAEAWWAQWVAADASEPAEPASETLASEPDTNASETPASEPDEEALGAARTQAMEPVSVAETADTQLMDAVSREEIDEAASTSSESKPAAEKKPAKSKKKRSRRKKRTTK